ncbi:MAG TPA: lysine-sensitive aspartokinase 3 [Thermoanaerobaculia bacterium]|nr:lysine-sensitive aspartokinase 3 [Thermoanaerobaculia bacterium]
MIVIKFGGTSVGDSERMEEAIEIVAAARDRRPVVIVSALAGVTNQLVEAARLAADGSIDEVTGIVEAIRERHESVARELVRQKSDYLESFMKQLRRHTDQILDILKGIAHVGEVTQRAGDKIVAIGEKLSSLLFAYSLRLRTFPGEYIDSEEVIITDARFGQASPLMNETKAAAGRVLLPELERNHIPVMGGFIGRSLQGATTTLGRGGSDYSAAIVGAAIEAEEIQIWTDVDGMMTTDPRINPEAKIIDVISYVEAAELAYFGAKVLHPKTIAPAVERGIPIRVLNTRNRTSRGTLITREGKSESGPRAIAVKNGITVVHITTSQMLGAHGFLARIFKEFDEESVPVDLVTTSEVSVSVTIDRSDKIESLTGRLRAFAEVDVMPSQSIIAIVGRNLMRDPAVWGSIFPALAGVRISMISLGTSDLNLSIAVPEKEAERAVRSLHRVLFESERAEVA